MEPEWAVIIGMGIAGLIREVYLLIKVTSESTQGKSQKKLAGIISIIIGVLIIIPFIGLIGVAVGIFALRKTTYAGLAKTGIALNVIAIILWTIIAIGGG